MTTVAMEDILKLVSLQLGVRHVNPQDRLLEDLSAESADVANLITRVEEKYHVLIKETEIAKIFTPEDLFRLVNTKLGDSHF